MSAFTLLLALREYLAPKLATFPLAVRERVGIPSPGLPEDIGPCAIHLGSMPPTANEALSAAPFILLQVMDGEMEDKMDNLRLAIRLCIVADDYEAAENDLLNLLAEIRLWLMELPGGVLGKYRLLPGLPWERPDEQVHPFLQAHIFSNWQTRGASKRPNLKMIDYE